MSCTIHGCWAIAPELPQNMDRSFATNLFSWPRVALGLPSANSGAKVHDLPVRPEGCGMSADDALPHTACIMIRSQLTELARIHPTALSAAVLARGSSLSVPPAPKADGGRLEGRSVPLRPTALASPGSFFRHFVRKLFGRAVRTIWAPEPSDHGIIVVRTPSRCPAPDPSGSAFFDSVSPGIRTNDGCDYTVEIEPDQDRGWCKSCGTNTVKSALILAGLI